MMADGATFIYYIKPEFFYHRSHDEKNENTGMKITQTGSHLDHMLKQTRAHHVQLSAMADAKANMLLTIASVIITLSVPQLMQPGLRAAALVLIGFSLLTILLSTYAVMPKLPIIYKPGSNEAPKGSMFNLLFFGDFTRMSWEDYSESMEKVLNDPSLTYETMVKEIYSLGTFLARKKYRFIRLSYAAFIVGVFATVIVMLFTGNVLTQI